MRDKLFKLAGLGIVCVLALSPDMFAGPKRISSMASDERAIRSLMTRWVEAFNDLDAKRLAALETPDLQAVDRFGVLHLAYGRSENAELWADSFEVVSRNTALRSSRLTAFGFFGRTSPSSRRLGGFQKESCLSTERASLHFHKSTPMS